MKKSLVTCAFLSVLLLAACQPGKESKENKAMQEVQQQIARVPFPKNVSIAGTYTDYSEGVIGNGEVSVLYFTTDSNPDLKQTEDVLDQIYGSLPVGVHTYKVNLDTEPDLKQRYSIKGQNTFIVINAAGDPVSMGNALSPVALANTLARAAGMNVQKNEGMMQEDASDEQEGELMQGMPAMDGNMQGDEHMVENMGAMGEEGMESAPPTQEPQGLAMGKCTAFTDDVIGNGKSSILFFAASWCPSCQAHSDRLASWYEGGTIYPSVYKVDYDNSNDLKSRFGVVQQDTFVRIDGEGNAVKLISFPDDSALWEFLIETY